MPVDSFKCLPRIIATFYQMTDCQPELPISWTPLPRPLAVEFPFGHTLGQPHRAAQQMRVIRQALEVLETGEAPGTIVHSAEMWPVPQKEALKDWQPRESSPLMEVLAPHFLKVMRQRRKEYQNSG